ncbi:unnamed protein product [Phytophthora fragariaefolia]|uniref:Unnamed protein product n=1 Tax=Phytophthora fragariaefolia TaxID=1490495 RepID=A0A9W6WVT8_9STRA|nr:unnamed protein product [Phytophthora fragariaefolia]
MERTAVQAAEVPTDLKSATNDACATREVIHAEEAHQPQRPVTRAAKRGGAEARRRLEETQALHDELVTKNGAVVLRKNAVTPENDTVAAVVDETVMGEGAAATRIDVAVVAQYSDTVNAGDETSRAREEVTPVPTTAALTEQSDVVNDVLTPQKTKPVDEIQQPRRPVTRAVQRRIDEDRRQQRAVPVDDKEWQMKNSIGNRVMIPPNDAEMLEGSDVPKKTNGKQKRRRRASDVDSEEEDLDASEDLVDDEAVELVCDEGGLYAARRRLDMMVYDEQT